MSLGEIQDYFCQRRNNYLVSKSANSYGLGSQILFNVCLQKVGIPTHFRSRRMFILGPKKFIKGPRCISKYQNTII